jgi:ribosomal protein L11 methylase PrmA
MYLPTPQDVVERMLASAAISKNDLVYDLGCGDGRVLVTAAKTYGCRCRGYDVDPLRVRDSLRNARQHGVEELIEVERKDIFTLDLKEADVVFLYLLPELNVRLIPQLQQLKPGTRIVSHLFDMQGVTPDKVLHFNSSEDSSDHVVYVWTAPLRSAKQEGTPPR